MSCTVYQYFGTGGHLLYVGITERGVKRAHEHAGSKAWWKLATGCTLEHFDTREEALEREAYLIRTYRPPYNQQHNPERSLPIEQRTGMNNRNRPARPSAPGMKERMRAYYNATPTERASMACAMCQERPPVNGPCCVACQTARRERTTAA
ncbi:GIY-YIG nuclease family protein [Streptomyces sp. NPDC047079]|uniref:GIY-YIG nuclease family protein n=1 Tax=Streptomyces sp. NPDC047079 TaxID=3154607 RepID=UPI0033FB6F1B